eukprot:9424365-Alexandrium_andersonii.AAC.1
MGDSLCSIPRSSLLGLVHEAGASAFRTPRGAPDAPSETFLAVRAPHIPVRWHQCHGVAASKDTQHGCSKLLCA